MVLPPQSAARTKGTWATLVNLNVICSLSSRVQLLFWDPEIWLRRCCVWRGTKIPKWTVGGCKWCFIFVWMLWSSITALKSVYECSPTRPDGRAVDLERFRWMDVGRVVSALGNGCRMGRFSTLNCRGWICAFNSARYSAIWRTPA